MSYLWADKSVASTITPIDQWPEHLGTHSADLQGAVQ